MSQLLSHTSNKPETRNPKPETRNPAQVSKDLINTFNVTIVAHGGSFNPTLGLCICTYVCVCMYVCACVRAFMRVRVRPLERCNGS
jgi:hypothetical protein